MPDKICKSENQSIIGRKVFTFHAVNRFHDCGAMTE